MAIKYANDLERAMSVVPNGAKLIKYYWDTERKGTKYSPVDRRILVVELEKNGKEYRTKA